jgi:dienelactone hydrolase
VRFEDVVLESSDGTRLAAFLAVPDDGARVGVVVLPDVRGLYRFYEVLALRFAERGFAALAFDYFGRTAGVGRGGASRASRARPSYYRRFVLEGCRRRPALQEGARATSATGESSAWEQSFDERVTRPVLRT